MRMTVLDRLPSTTLQGHSGPCYLYRFKKSPADGIMQTLLWITNYAYCFTTLKGKFTGKIDTYYGRFKIYHASKEVIVLAAVVIM